ncbi:MAG: hypothetical protein CVV27_10120 [Candidatus Melainabacteria bacterium HGW-Melainabacteria-1]|nr:MAG: hypothetical protein CVV27_10120 [Candidatus Melainabacteria bacterium HGW-Melainabacteria-1]
MASELDLSSQLRVEGLRSRARELSTELVLKHDRDTLWPYLSNTDMINARSKLPPVRILPMRSEGQLIIESQDLGLPIRYLELPYEWIRPGWLQVERIFTRGGAAYLRFALSLSDEGPGQTRARLSLAVVPKLPWLLLKPRLQMILNQLQRSYSEIDQRLSRQALALAGEAFGEDPAKHADRIEMLSQDWRSLTQNSELPRLMAEYICCAPERYVRRMRPFELARRYGIDRFETLRFCLRATREGFLNLSWDLLCPSCQGAKGQSLSLSTLEPDVHCDACGIDYTGRFDENFEVTFAPVASLRSVQDAAYCAGSPANTGHICLQRNLWPGQVLDIPLDLPSGHYRLRGGASFRIEAGGLSRHALSLALQPAAEIPALAPGAILQLSNPSDSIHTLRIEDLGWREDRVSAGLVSTLQDFRDMFGSEVLRPGVNLAVSNLSVMFTDLKDSTRMYELCGDASAFSLVQQHFEIMIELIRDDGGAIVKTIGDAVMAVFQDPLQALACGLNIQREFRQWNREWHHDDPDQRVVIKLGLHLGPCIALNLNERLDYFGSTINKAARIQNESIGDDLVISEDILTIPGARDLLSGHQLTRFSKALKGLSGEAVLYRIEELEAEASPSPVADTKQTDISNG